MRHNIFTHEWYRFHIIICIHELCVEHMASFLLQIFIFDVKLQCHFPIKTSGSAEIWTRITGFRVQSANHYTTEPCSAGQHAFGELCLCWHLPPKASQIFHLKLLVHANQFTSAATHHRLNLAYAVWCDGRDRIAVSTSRCGRDNPGSNPGHGRAVVSLCHGITSNLLARKRDLFQEAHMWKDYFFLAYSHAGWFPICMASDSTTNTLLQLKTPWRNGSASDSRSEGCVFKSRRGQRQSFLMSSANTFRWLVLSTNFTERAKRVRWSLGFHVMKALVAIGTELHIF